MTSETQEYQARRAHLLACGVLDLEAELIASGAGSSATTQAVREFSKSPLTFCLLTGGTGSGKTIAACEALLNAKARWGPNGEEWGYLPSEGRFVMAAELARLSYFDVESQRTLGRLERVRWLVLDDLGGELVTDTWRSNLGALMNARNSTRLKTLITTNLGTEEIKDRYDARIISRIRGSGVVIHSGNVDLRRGLKAVGDAS